MSSALTLLKAFDLYLYLSTTNKTAEKEARIQEENKRLAKRLKEKTRALDEEIKSRELDYDDLEFDEGEDAILGEGAFGIVRRAMFHGQVRVGGVAVPKPEGKRKNRVRC